MTRRVMLRNIPRQLFVAVAISAALVSIVVWIESPGTSAASHMQVMPLWPLLGIAAALMAGVAGVAACRPGHAIVSPALMGMLARLLARQVVTSAGARYETRARKIREPSGQAGALVARRQRQRTAGAAPAQVAAAKLVRAEQQALGRRREELEREGKRLLEELLWIDYRLEQLSAPPASAATAVAFPAVPVPIVHPAPLTLALQAHIAANQRAADQHKALFSSDFPASSVRVRERHIIRSRAYRPQSRPKQPTRVLAHSRRQMQRYIPYPFFRRAAALAQVVPYRAARFERSLSHWLIGRTYISPIALIKTPTGTSMPIHTSRVTPMRTGPTQTQMPPSPLSGYRITPVLMTGALPDATSDVAHASVHTSTPQHREISDRTPSKLRPSGEDRYS